MIFELLTLGFQQVCFEKIWMSDQTGVAESSLFHIGFI